MQAFVLLAGSGNFLEGSEQLYISQPSLFRHISHMEDKLGADMFHMQERSKETGKEEYYR